MSATSTRGRHDTGLPAPGVLRGRVAEHLRSGGSTGGVLAVFYGMTVAFLALAVLWWGQTRSTETYSMPEPTTTLTLTNGPHSVSEEQQVMAARRLRAALTREGVSMVKDSQGDGDPVLVVLDPEQRISWARTLSTDSRPGVYAIRGTYSDRTWATRGQAPLAPPGHDVLGTISVPGVTPSASSLQFAELLGSSPLGTGRLLLGTTDPSVIARATALLEDSGLSVESTWQQPVLVSLVRDSTAATAALFVGLGIVCAALSLALSLPEQRGEIRLRLLVGATGTALIRERAGRELLPITAGTAFGVLGAGTATSLVAAAPPSSLELAALVVGTVTGGLILWLVRQLTFGTWLRLELRRDGT
ncbi:hypothetical protein [Actinomyces viscosus]|uniref:hypothetical protein n=1 Tax=Actinomyces viscosus TaxID=1656 RepID=UPI0028E2E2D6|nr:hypothetical protein [Actinomyces viscosus]